MFLKSYQIHQPTSGSKQYHLVYYVESDKELNKSGLVRCIAQFDIDKMEWIIKRLEVKIISK